MQPTFDQAEAWPRLEAAVREAVAVLPHFPGFDSRNFGELAGDDPGWAFYELSYTFTEADSATPAVREDYVSLLRRRLPALGYHITDQRSDPRGRPRALEATRPDGVNLWYRVLGLVSVKAQCGPVRRTDTAEAYCPRPIGGVSPDRDGALDYCGHGYTDQASAPVAGTDPYEL